MLVIFTPKLFTKITTILLPIIALLFPCTLITGLYFALFQSPPDYQQGEMVRVMYVHVPAAWMSLGIYSFIALCSFSTLVWKTRLLYIFAVAAAPIGAAFALITLVTGSLWGYPVWGTWWVWDARLTSMLILFLLYISYMAIVNNSSDMMRAEKPASVMALIGFINIPIVKFSVNIWYSLHQPASVLRLGGPTIHSSMLLPLVVMFASFILYFILIFLLRIQTILNEQKNRERGVK
ncbi:MAG: heme ABC transporter permease [Rickettsiaceae bacterium]